LFLRVWFACVRVRVGCPGLAVQFDLADIREGRGERALFVWALLALLPRFPRTVVATLRLVPEFASWCTLNLVADEAAARTRDPGTPREQLPLFTSVRDEIVRLYVAQLRADEAALAADADAHVSLAGKWAPGMASRFERVSHLGTALRDALFPTGVTALQQTLADDGDAAAADRARRCANFASMRYRRLLSRLRQRIGVVEQLMSAKRWGDIVPEHVPSAANMKYRKALLNKGVDGTGVRDAADAGRVLCAERFKAAAKATVAVAAAAALAAAQGVAAPATLTKTLKGARNQPHKLVEAVMPGHHAHRLGADEAELVDAMWAALVTELRAKGTLKPSLALVDVSGSMSGLPMTVAVALGLLLSELAPPPWTGRMMTFAGTPAWFTCPEGATTLQARVAATMGMDWDMSTNFARALELVLTTAVEGGLPANALPEVLFVLTDMQFDAAGGMDPHAAALVRRRFAEYNYTPPHIVFWNLRATDMPIYQAETSDPGVSFMSGFSPQMFADFLSDGVLASGSTVTPWETVHARLNRPRLLPVRRVCECVGEGVMAGYVVVASTESAESE
jgi:hypothetical protein